MANRFNRSIREIRDIEKQPLHTNEQNDLLSDINDDVYVRLRRRYERITGLPELEKRFNSHLMDYNQFKDDTQQMLIYLNDVNERQDMMIDKLNTDVDDLIKKAKRLKEISDEHTEKLVSLTNDLINVKNDVENNRGLIITTSDNLNALFNRIEKEDKQDKLQSEIDELRKTVEAIKTDVEETQAIEDMKKLSENMKNFVSVSSNITQNVASQNDMIYFDVYTLGNVKDEDFMLFVQSMDKKGNLDDGKEVTKDGFTFTKIGDNYYTVGYNIKDLEKIVVFTLFFNKNIIHIKQVKLSDYQ